MTEEEKKAKVLARRRELYQQNRAKELERKKLYRMYNGDKLSKYQEEYRAKKVNKEKPQILDHKYSKSLSMMCFNQKKIFSANRLHPISIFASLGTGMLRSSSDKALSSFSVKLV